MFAFCSSHQAPPNNTGLPIQIFEVKVTSSSGANIALNGSATQSSTFSNDQDKFGANNAVDGDLVTMSHTADSFPWWKVDLGESYDISSVEIVNRWCTDMNDSKNCLCRLSGAALSLLDDSGEEITSISIGDTCEKLVLEMEFERFPEFCQVPVQLSFAYSYVLFSLSLTISFLLALFGIVFWCTSFST